MTLFYTQMHLKVMTFFYTRKAEKSPHSNFLVSHKYSVIFVTNIRSVSVHKLQKVLKKRKYNVFFSHILKTMTFFYAQIHPKSFVSNLGEPRFSRILEICFKLHFLNRRYAKVWLLLKTELFLHVRQVICVIREIQANTNKYKQKRKKMIHRNSQKSMVFQEFSYKSTNL